MATTTSTPTGTIDRPMNSMSRQSIYWIIAAAVVLLIALGYAVSPNRTMNTTVPAVETTAPATTTLDPTVPATDPALMSPTNDPAMNGGAAMETNDPMVTEPMATEPMTTDPAVTAPENAPQPSTTTNGN